MEIKDAQYVKDLNNKNINVKAKINGVESFVPLSEDNSHYAEILKQVKAGTLTIKDAD